MVTHELLFTYQEDTTSEQVEEEKEVRFPAERPQLNCPLPESGSK